MRASAANAVGIVVDLVEGAGLEINGRQRAAIGRYAKLKLEAGEEEALVLDWAKHYGSRLAARANIKPSQAWEDVTGQATANPAAIAGSSLSREKAAANRVKQMKDAGLIPPDWDGPLTRRDEIRARRWHQWLAAWRARCDRELGERDIA